MRMMERIDTQSGESRNAALVAALCDIVAGANLMLSLGSFKNDAFYSYAAEVKRVAEAALATALVRGPSEREKASIDAIENDGRTIAIFVSGQEESIVITYDQARYLCQKLSKFFK